MSRALVSWRLSGSPEALTNCVLVMPSSWARSVIRAANLGSLPPIRSARATAMSLADFTATARMASSTVMVWPAERPSFDGAIEAA